MKTFPSNFPFEFELIKIFGKEKKKKKKLMDQGLFIFFEIQRDVKTNDVFGRDFVFFVFVL